MSEQAHPRVGSMKRLVAEESTKMRGIYSLAACSGIEPNITLAETLSAETTWIKSSEQRFSFGAEPATQMSVFPQPLSSHLAPRKASCQVSSICWPQRRSTIPWIARYSVH